MTGEKITTSIFLFTNIENKFIVLNTQSGLIGSYLRENKFITLTMLLMNIFFIHT